MHCILKKKRNYPMPAPAAARRVAARVGENGREHCTHAAQVCITYVQYGFFFGRILVTELEHC